MPLPRTLLYVASTLTDLVNKAARYTSYSTHTFNDDPNIPSGTLGPLSVAQATDLVREHLTRDPRLRDVRAESYGAITLHQGTQLTRMEPGTDARPNLLTARQAEDLLCIDRAGSRAMVRHDKGRGWTIRAGLDIISPSFTERLVAHGWIATTGEDGAPVDLSLAGTVALTWRHCKTEKILGERCAEQIAEHVVDVYAPPF